MGRSSTRLPMPRRGLIGQQAQSDSFDSQEPSGAALAVPLELAGEIP